MAQCGRGSTEKRKEEVKRGWKIMGVGRKLKKTRILRKLVRK